MIEFVSILLTFTFIRPFVGVCIAVFLDFFLSSYPVLTIPPRNYIVVALLIVLMFRVIGRRRFKKPVGWEEKLFLASGALIALGLFLRIVNDAGVVGFVGRVVVPFSLMLASVYFVNSQRRFMLFLYCIAGGMAISALVGIFQFFSFDWAWDLHALLNPFVGEGLAPVDIYARTRIPGLAPYSVPFAYALCAFSPLFIALSSSPRRPKSEIICFRSAAVISGIAILLTLSRSAILGFFISIAYIGISGKSVARKILISILGAFMVLAALLIPNVHTRIRSNNENERGTLARSVLGLRIALQNPLGTGGASQAYTESVDSNFGAIYEYQGAQASNIESPHNQFINTLAYYGVAGFILLIACYYCIFKLLREIREIPGSKFISSCAVGLEASFIAYTIHSLFHNAGPFIGEIYIWYLVAALLMLNRMSAANSAPALCPK